MTKTLIMSKKGIMLPHLLTKQMAFVTKTFVLNSKTENTSPTHTITATFSFTFIFGVKIMQIPLVTGTNVSRTVLDGIDHFVSFGTRKFTMRRTQERT